METISESLFGTMEKVSFRRENLSLAGHLFKPADFDHTKVYPTLIVHAAVTMVKEQAPDNYARLLVLMQPRMVGKMTQRAWFVTGVAV